MTKRIKVWVNSREYEVRTVTTASEPSKSATSAPKPEPWPVIGQVSEDILHNL